MEAITQINIDQLVIAVLTLTVTISKGRIKPDTMKQSIGRDIGNAMGTQVRSR